MTDSGSDSNKPIYTWLLTSGLLLFGLFLLWRFQVLSMIVNQDRTYLSLLIFSLFILTCLYLGYASFVMSRLGNAVRIYVSTGDTSKIADDELLSVLNTHRQFPERSAQGQSFHAWLVERIHRGHSLGWFMSESLIRLGLIGTVIGFIMMLGSVYGLEDQDVNTLKDLLGSMGGGMQVALYTTLTGITCSLVLNVYCRNLDRHADDLVGQILLTSLVRHQSSRDAQSV